MEPWWQLEPERYEDELRRLDEAGIDWRRDEAAWKAGILKLHLVTRVEDEEIRLVAVFPDLYPFFRFEIAAPDEELPRHQHPLSKYLCLIGRRTDNWEVSDTLATFVTERVPLAIRLGRAALEDERLANEGEEHQGEPFSDYYPYASGSIVLVDSAWTIPLEVTSGTLELRLEDGRVPLVRGVVAVVRDSSGNSIAQCDEALLPRYPLKMLARWYRMSDAIGAVEPAPFLDQLIAAHPGARVPQGTAMGKVNVDVTAVIFPEELQWRELGDGWTFLVRYRGKKQHGKARGQWVPYFARPGRAGRADLSMRIPELAPLANKVIAVVGLGGLGGPSAIEFARCGMKELRLLEFDHMEAGTAVRWPLGIPFAGVPKVELAGFIRDNWPYTDVIAYQHRLGSTRGPQDKSDLEIVEEILAEVDLIYDASAEPGIQYLLGELARERAIPYVAVSSTTGAWGGRLVRIVPGRTEGCWVCLMHHLVDESVPASPADPDGEIQPTGCADPTFTGASFDLAPVVNEGVRLAVATLCLGEDHAYPDPGWEVGVLSLRDDEGHVIPPAWWTSNLMRHPRCGRCATAA